MKKAMVRISNLKNFTYDRFSEVVKFHDLSEADVRIIADELCETRLADDAVSYIHGQANRFRRVVVWLYKAEAFARTNSLKEITAQHLSGAKR